MTCYVNTRTSGESRERNSVGYLCGHPGMIESAKGILKRIGVHQRKLMKEEIYWVPTREEAKSA